VTGDLLLIGFLAAAIFWLALRGGTGSGNESSEKKPRVLHRWRRFKVRPAALYGDEDSDAAAIAEDPKGIKLPVVRGCTDELPLWLGGDARHPLLRIERRIIAPRTLVLKLGKHAWLRLRPNGSAAFPTLSMAEVVLPKGAPDPSTLQFQGSLAEREYEIRQDGRLVVSVSWQRDERGSSASRGRYVVEIVRSAPCEALLALTLALETVATLDGEPADVENLDESADEKDAAGEEKPAGDEEKVATETA